MGIAAARKGLRTLVISTDPAPSLADALDVRLGATARRVTSGTLPLHALELDAPRAFLKWVSGRRAVLEGIAVRGTWLDQEDVARLLRLSLPGIDEVAALFEILALVRSGRYDLVVVDTAPTGHTLRLLSMPETLRRVAGVFDAMQSKHRAIVGALRGYWQPDAGDILIAELAEAAADLSSLLRDAERMQVCWVTLPEPMAVSETIDGIEDLRRGGIPLESVVVNRLTAAPVSACPRCAARLVFEARALKDLRRRLPRVPLRFIRTRRVEPRGLSHLGAIGREIGETSSIPAARGAATWRAWSPEKKRPAILEVLPVSTRLLMFGGKGGVGKTTCAAAASLVLAAVAPRRRVLLVSTDPAHSAGDALGLSLDDVPRLVPGGPRNLQVRELDAAARFAALRDRYAAAIEALFSRLTRGSAVDASHDRRVLQELIALAPPGIDELVAVAEVADLVQGDGPVGLIVMDLAPSGHALRLLETPALVQDWVKVLMAILLKYRSIVGIGELGEMLLGLSKSLGRLRELLRDPDLCRFVPVARAAALPRAETARLLKRLSRLGIPVAALIVNAAGRGSCGRCLAESAAERRELRLLAEQANAAGIPLLVAPETVPPPAGRRALRQWCESWRGKPPRRS